MREVLDSIRTFATDITIQRSTGETVERGWVTQGRTDVLNARGHMQPMSDKELRFVPEGMNTLEWHVLWSLNEIKVDDIITDGTTPLIKIVKVKFWKEAPFWHAQGVKVDDALVRARLVDISGAQVLTAPSLSGLLTVTP